MGWTHLLDDSGQPTGERVGDEAWDLIGQAFTDLIALYQTRFNRPPTRNEIDQILAFTMPKGDDLFLISDRNETPEPSVSMQSASLWVGLGTVLTIVAIVAMLVHEGRVPW